MTTRFFAWAAALAVACCGCRACSNCFDYSSPVAEPVGDGTGRAGSILSQVQQQGVVPVSYEADYVVSRSNQVVDAAYQLPWPEQEEEAPQELPPPPPLKDISSMLVR